MSKKADGWSVAKAHDRPNRVFLKCVTMDFEYSKSYTKEAHGFCGGPFSTKNMISFPEVQA